MHLLAPFSKPKSHEELFLEHYSSLVERALQITRKRRDEANDLVHDLYVLLIRTRPDIDLSDDDRVRGYLYTMLRNLSVSKARRAGLDALARGLDHVLDTGAAGLSGGEQQRLALARALLRNSPVLILDESTSALDVPTEAALLLAVRRFRPEMATVLISHRLKSLDWVDRFVVLEHGRIVGEGNHWTLQRESRSYRALLDAEPDIPFRVFTERDEVAFARRAGR